MFKTRLCCRIYAKHISQHPERSSEYELQAYAKSKPVVEGWGDF